MAKPSNIKKDTALLSILLHWLKALFPLSNYHQAPLNHKWPKTHNKYGIFLAV